MSINLKHILLNILFPIQCLFCAKEGLLLCESCKTKLHMFPPVCIECGQMTPDKPPLFAGHTCAHCVKKTPIRFFLSPLSYRHPQVRRLIHEFKYRRITTLAPILADILAVHISSYGVTFPEASLIMPIPLHPRKERVRGFNQAMLLADEFSKRSSLPMDRQTLIRATPTQPQIMLTARSRRENVQNVFSVRNATLLRRKTIILIDDVKTTGATLTQAAHALKKAGAKQIWAITVAH